MHTEEEDSYTRVNHEESGEDEHTLTAKAKSDAVQRVLTAEEVDRPETIPSQTHLFRTEGERLGIGKGIRTISQLFTREKLVEKPYKKRNLYVINENGMQFLENPVEEPLKEPPQGNPKGTPKGFPKGTPRG